MGRFLEFHKQCLETGKLPEIKGGGLCWTLGYETVKIFEPSPYDNLGMGDPSYWGSGLSYTATLSELAFSYTPLRQTIVCFLAAMNNEI